MRGQTRKYNLKLKFGKGFTLEEIKKAGLTAQFAPTIGIAVDHRRQNTSLEALQANVDRLKAYMSKMILFPRKMNKPKKGIVPDSNEEKLQSVEAKQQHKTKEIIKMPTIKKREKPMLIPKEMKDFKAYQKIKLEMMNKKWEGARKKAAEESKE